MFLRTDLVVIALLTCVLPLTACDRSPESSDVPAQRYTSRINLIGKSAGSLRGQIVFPSAYSQRSASFFVNGVQLASLPDGRFWVRSIPVGDHQVRVYVPGFEPIVRAVQIGSGTVTDAHTFVLQPARGRIMGRIVTDDGRSASGAVIRLEPYGLIGSADKDGIFQFMGVGGGEHLLAVQCIGCEREERTLTLHANEARNLGILTVHRRNETVGEPVQARTGAGG